MKEQRLGMHNGFWQKQLSKDTPFLKSLSRLGVKAAGWPFAPRTSYRIWSVVIQMTFFGRMPMCRPSCFVFVAAHSRQINSFGAGARLCQPCLLPCLDLGPFASSGDAPPGR
jgi:hypothetical protein